ncbi:tyrosine-type recombinase/integrase [Methanocaldococcus sp.]|uniref:tyrosine-type recombinase/integrase n=1 Tax=Methanocaldococcus sp. TaxID=2152917 RepID=UPI00261E56C9|nr:tyrosine-type recombinase/integrase [Methanocaldococcus sp.]MCQ6254551.1 tyrosine-type recombinase/integrase [Methanocaldococcus sp.]
MVLHMKTWDWFLTNNNYQKPKIKQKGTWDKGIDYEITYKTFQNDLKKLKNKKILYKKDLKKYAYLIVFLTQLRNGCRIWEAIVSIINFCLNHNTIDWANPTVLIRTQKRSDGTTREIILPKCIKKEDIEKVRPIFLDIVKEFENAKTIEEKQKIREKIVKRLNAWLYKNYNKLNSHSLRYAYITYLSKKGIPAQILAKITKHKNINYIEHYTQSKLAKEILKNIGDVDD